MTWPIFLSMSCGLVRSVCICWYIKYFYIWYSGSQSCNYYVHASGTRMQQWCFYQTLNHMSWDIMVWMVISHLAMWPHTVSSLSKGSVWDVDVPDHLSRAGGHMSFEWKFIFSVYVLISVMPFFMCSLLKTSFDGVHVICAHPAAAPQRSHSIKHEPFQSPDGLLV